MTAAALRRAEAGRATRFVLVGITGLAVNTAALAAFSSGLHLHYLVGVVLATQCSTIWNFALAERWVFRANAGADTRRALVKRYVQFSVVNNAALLVRGPMIVVLTDRVGLHYLLSSVVSLLVLFVARYLLADRMIWRTAVPATAQVTAAGG